MSLVTKKRWLFTRQNKFEALNIKPTWILTCALFIFICLFFKNDGLPKFVQQIYRLNGTKAIGCVSVSLNDQIYI